MTKQEFARFLKNPLFGSRDSVEDAYEYAIELLKAEHSHIARVTALGVVLNTLAEQIEKLED